MFVHKGIEYQTRYEQYPLIQRPHDAILMLNVSRMSCWKNSKQIGQNLSPSGMLILSAIINPPHDWVASLDLYKMLNPLDKNAEKPDAAIIRPVINRLRTQLASADPALWESIASQWSCGYRFKPHSSVLEWYKQDQRTIHFNQDA